MFSTTQISIILLASLSIISTIIGVALAYYFKKSQKGISVGIGFSAGIMVLISFFELLPETIQDVGPFKALLALLFGVLFVGALNLVIPHTHLTEEENKNKSRLLKTAYLIVFGLILHDFPEGFAMASSYIHSPSMGFLIALAIAIHNVPEEFAMSIPLLLAGKRELLIKAAILSALAEPIGAILGILAIGFLPGLNSFLMAFAAGAMIFVSLHELWPMAQRYKRISLSVLGVLLSVIVYIGLNLLIKA